MPDEFSSVCHQPQSDEEVLLRDKALLCCPTGSIGTKEKTTPKIFVRNFPLLIEDNVYYSGFNSPSSYGANSFFVKEETGNWLVDSPKYLPFLADQIEKLGGIKYIFLTHRDDVADAQKYAQRFSAGRIIHLDDLGAQPDCEDCYRRRCRTKFR